MITITIPKISLFIQTDKPTYKPGQTGNKTNHLCSFMDGSLKTETCISQSLANYLENPNQLATSYQLFTNHVVEFKLSWTTKDKLFIYSRIWILSNVAIYIWCGLKWFRVKMIWTEFFFLIFVALFMIVNPRHKEVLIKEGWNHLTWNSF